MLLLGEIPSCLISYEKCLSSAASNKHQCIKATWCFSNVCTIKRCAIDGEMNFQMVNFLSPAVWLVAWGWERLDIREAGILMAAYWRKHTDTGILMWMQGTVMMEDHALLRKRGTCIKSSMPVICRVSAKYSSLISLQVSVGCCLGGLMPWWTLMVLSYVLCNSAGDILHFLLYFGCCEANLFSRYIYFLSYATVPEIRVRHSYSPLQVTGIRLPGLVSYV